MSVQILVLGVGNILMTDEGAGVYAVRKLEQTYKFSDNVTILDGGTLGMRLLHSISQSTCLIVADTAMYGHEPGTLTRMAMSDLPMGAVVKNSMHQLSFTETLTMAKAMGYLPQTVVITIEPSDIETMSVTCTPEVEKKIATMCSMLLDEIVVAGGVYTSL